MFSSYFPLRELAIKASIVAKVGTLKLSHRSKVTVSKQPHFWIRNDNVGVRFVLYVKAVAATNATGASQNNDFNDQNNSHFNFACACGNTVFLSAGNPYKAPQYLSSY